MRNSASRRSARSSGESSRAFQARRFIRRRALRCQSSKRAPTHGESAHNSPSITFRIVPPMLSSTYASTSTTIDARRTCGTAPISRSASANGLFWSTRVGKINSPFRKTKIAAANRPAGWRGFLRLSPNVLFRKSPTVDSIEPVNVGDALIYRRTFVLRASRFEVERAEVDRLDVAHERLDPRSGALHAAHDVRQVILRIVVEQQIVAEVVVGIAPDRVNVVTLAG